MGRKRINLADILMFIKGSLKIIKLYQDLIKENAILLQHIHILTVVLSSNFLNRIKLDRTVNFLIRTNFGFDKI